MQSKKMKTQNKRMVNVWYSLYDRMLNRSNLVEAFLKVKSSLALLGKFLKSGVMVGDEWQASETGSPRGLISPLIANVYLDSFDQFMKGRGHRIVRYADDILILCQSEKAATNALAKASRYLEEDLLLTVNREKTHVTHSWKGESSLECCRSCHRGYEGACEPFS
jgi:RNA-directed DNA polymerase